MKIVARGTIMAQILEGVKGKKARRESAGARNKKTERGRPFG
jgi:hypothetical protein